MAESRAILSLASILSFRMLGLFMIYPIFAIYAPHYQNTSATLIGIVLGIYGLTQALLQLPLSMLSDHLGRKKIIYSGLIVFALGSVICALTNNIYFLVIGRALQGSGAIGSTLIAYAADLTSEENRTKAMALLGITIGMSFGLAMVIGPIIDSWLHLSGIFWLTALLALSGLLILHFFVPTPEKAIIIKKQPLTVLKQLLTHPSLFKLNISILFLHAIFTASFVVLPLLLTNSGMIDHSQWKIYLPVLIVAGIISMSLIVIIEKKKLVKLSLQSGIILIALAQYLFFAHAQSVTTLILALTLFFTGFTLLEAMLPSLISKLAPSEHKGSALGIYSTFQFLGIFLGGLASGLISSHYHHSSILLYCLLTCGVWLLLICSTTNRNLSISQNHGVAYPDINNTILD